MCKRVEGIGESVSPRTGRYDTKRCLAEGSRVTWCIVLVKIGLIFVILRRHHLSSSQVKKFVKDDG